MALKTKTKCLIYTLLLVGMALIFPTAISFGQDSTETVTDIEGNVYRTVKIGMQTWMAENLKVTRFNYGVAINNFTSEESWKVNSSDYSGYSWYRNDIFFKDMYGALYNWNAASHEKLCPKGWHTPSSEEWTVLIDYLGGPTVAGGKMKATGSELWNPPNEGANNESGFTALPGGFIAGDIFNDFFFAGIGERSAWWTSTKVNSKNSIYFQVIGSNTEATSFPNKKTAGMSVRCLKD